MRMDPVQRGVSLGLAKNCDSDIVVRLDINVNLHAIANST